MGATSNISCYAAIRATSEKLKALVGSAAPRTKPVASSLLPLPRVQLPTTASIVDRLADIGLPLAVAVRFQMKYEHLIEQLRLNFEARIRRAQRKLASLPQPQGRRPLVEQLSHIASAFCIVYGRMVDKATSDIIERCHVLLAQRAAHCQEIVKRSPAFNPEFTPLLEQYFAENAYPSRADKALLAAKTGMSLYQIHIWFQNHRARGRKEGRAIVKKPAHEPPLLSADLLQNTSVHDRLIPESKRSIAAFRSMGDYEYEYETDDEQSSMAFCPARQLDAIDVLAPTTAPAKTPVEFVHDCLWRRKAATTAVYCPPADFEDLTDRLQKMSIKVKTPELRRVHKSTPLKPGKERFRTKPDRKPQYSKRATSFEVTPPPAPLPSFIPTGFVAQSPPTPPTTIRAVPARPEQKHVFATPPPTAAPVTLLTSPEPTVPPTAPSSPAASGRRRKLAALPRRTAPARESPALSPESASSRESPRSRTSSSSSGASFSSFSSFASSDSRNFSDTSAITTPPHDFTDLPAPELDFSGFDFDFSATEMGGGLGGDLAINQADLDALFGGFDDAVFNDGTLDQLMSSLTQNTGLDCGVPANTGADLFAPLSTPAPAFVPEPEPVSTSATAWNFSPFAHMPTIANFG